VDGSGNWSIAVASADVTAFAEGSESMTVVQIDVVGNASVESTAKVISIDAVIPVVTVTLTFASGVVVICRKSRINTGFGMLLIIQKILFWLMNDMLTLKNTK